MKKLLLIPLFVFICVSPAYAEMLLFVKEGCSFCSSLEGELTSQNLYQTFGIESFDISKDISALEMYAREGSRVGYVGSSVPLLIDRNEYFIGVNDILTHLSALELATKEPSTKLLTSNDSELLNDILKEEVEKQKGQTTNKIIGVLTIVFGLTLFASIIGRARRRRH